MDSRGSLWTSSTPVLIENFMIRWYIETTALSLLSVGLPMMALYADGSTTTMNDTNSVFDLGSSPTVTERIVIPAGEIESPVNPPQIFALIGLGVLRSPLSRIWRKTLVRVELSGIGRGLGAGSSGMSLLLGVPEGCP
ncbi:hypothetical protein B296_00056779 [Ensete ventricosum]|uniref:Uncharacterized protein n=1 Tax=Ensete ventricosum TaxID=4639 RepID=A0A426XG60_ENSVE|nr:hypothetical protein B296_00056779 [Ensete ventricosum]